MKHVARVLLGLIVSLLTITCSSPTLLPPAQGGGTLVVNLPPLGSNARTILPNFASEVTKITVTVSASGYSSQTQDTSSTGSITFHGLNAADWTINVVAYNNATPIGQGNATTTVISGSSAAINIPIIFSGFPSGNGTLDIPLSWANTVGVDYLSWSIDGGPATTVTGTSTTMSAALSPGVRVLVLTFKKGGAGGTPAGTFVESVNVFSGLTSNSWIDSTGTLQSTMTFSASNFLSSNASLGTLSVWDASTTGTPQTIGFSSTTYPYNLTTIPASNSLVFTPTTSIDGQAISYSWNGGSSTPITSGSVSANLPFVTSNYDNVLKITVTAPDGATTQIYTLTWSSGSLNVGVSAPNTAYQALAFADNTPTIYQGQAYTFQSSNAVLNALSGWAWTLGGTTQSSTSSSLILSPAATAAMLGTYVVVGTIAYNGVTYSANATLTVNRSASLNMTIPNPTPLSLNFSADTGPDLGGPYDILYVNSLLYVTDGGHHIIVSVNPTTGDVKLVAGQWGVSGFADSPTGSLATFWGPGALASDGANLFVADTVYNNIREINLATGAVTTLAGVPSSGGYNDGPGNGAYFNDPSGLWTDGTTLYVADQHNNFIRAIDILSRTVTTLPGTFTYPYRITSDGSNLYITEYMSSSTVQKLNLSSHSISTVGAATYNNPAGIIFVGSNLYVLDSDHWEVGFPLYSLSLTGTPTLVVSGVFNYPKGITTDGTNLYVADTNNSRIVKLGP